MAVSRVKGGKMPAIAVVVVEVGVQWEGRKALAEDYAPLVDVLYTSTTIEPYTDSANKAGRRSEG